MLAQPTRRATSHRALMERRTHSLEGRNFRRPEGSGMLIGDPLSEGSSASSTNRRPITELWGAEYSLYRVRGTQFYFQQGSGLLIDDPL